MLKYYQYSLNKHDTQQKTVLFYVIYSLNSLLTFRYYDKKKLRNDNDKYATKFYIDYVKSYTKLCVIYLSAFILFRKEA